jgi:hypothetical protein
VGWKPPLLSPSSLRVGPLGRFWSLRVRNTERRSRIVGEAGVLCAEDAFSVERPIQIEFRRGGSVTEKEMVSNADAYARQVDMFSTAI